MEVPVAVYFAYEDRELTEIYKDIETAITSDQAGSAFEGTVCEPGPGCSKAG